MKSLLLALLSASVIAAAQAPATPPAPAAAPERVQLVGLNEKEGVSVDRFLGQPKKNPVHLSHGTLLTHEILGAGDPNNPGPQGRVLEYRKLLATADLLAGAQTPLETYPDAYFFYVKSGQGRLDDGKQYWDLRADIAILVPPGVAHRLINTSDKEPLKLLMLQWTAGPDAKHELIVRDTRLLPWCEENAHWNNTSRCVAIAPVAHCLAALKLKLALIVSAPVVMFVCAAETIDNEASGVSESTARSTMLVGP